jgi:ABC-type transport system involved in multi-copper enzyme maturation permease subunit
MRGMIRDCMNELFDRKTIYVFAVIALIGVVGTIGSLLLDIRIMGRSFGADDMNRAFGNPMLHGYNAYMYVLVFLSVMATAGLIPGMLARGRADYYLSKPVSRTWMLLNKVFSIWVVYSGIMIVTFLVNYILSAALYGAFSFTIFYIIAINLLAFLIWLSVTAFAGVLTGSSAFTIMTAFAVWMAQKILTYHDFPKQFIDSKVVIYVIDALYYIFPKTGEISSLTDELATGGSASWMPLYSSLIFAAVLMFITIAIFRRKNY